MQPNIYLMIGDNYINETSNVSSKQEEFKRSNIHIYIHTYIFISNVTFTATFSYDRGRHLTRNCTVSFQLTFGEYL